MLIVPDFASVLADVGVDVVNSSVSASKSGTVTDRKEPVPSATACRDKRGDVGGRTEDEGDIEDSEVKGVSLMKLTGDADIAEAVANE